VFVRTDCFRDLVPGKPIQLRTADKMLNIIFFNLPNPMSSSDSSSSSFFFSSALGASVGAAAAGAARI